MARRGYTRTRRCAEGGCRESSFTHYDLKRDYADAVRRDAGNPWKCLKHSDPDRVLSPTNLEITHVTEPSVQKLSDYDGRVIGTYWGRSGFIYGEGFRAFAEDFPVGTQLVVTVRAVLPEGYEPPEPPPAPPLPSLAERFGADAQDLDL